MRRTSLIPSIMAVLFSPGCLLLSASTARAVPILLNNGIPNNVSAASPGIEVRDGGGGTSTTLNVLAGASIANESAAAPRPAGSVFLYENSVMNMSGGDLIDELFMYDSSTATITGGTIGDDITTDQNSSVVIQSVTLADDFEARGTSLMTINGGSFDEDVESFNSATVSIHGGTFQTGSDGGNIQAAENSVINIYGGMFGTSGSAGGGIIAGADDTDFTPALQPGVVNLYGGNISGQQAGLQAIGFGTLNVYGFTGHPTSISTANSGQIIFHEGPLQNLVASPGSQGIVLSGTDGSLANIAAEDSSIITIFGHSFKNFNGAVPLPYGPIGAAAGNLTGVLADGTAISNVPFIRNLLAGGTRGVIILAAIPEPGTITLITFALAGVMLVGRRQRGR